MDKEMLIKLKDKLTGISEILYKGNVTLGIADMGEVIPELAVLASWMSEEADRDKLVNDALSPLLAAMEEKDATDIADIIVYELVPVIEKMLQSI